MKPRALGRFLAEFLEGFSGADEPEAKADAPIVVPEDMVRRAVADFLAPMVEQAANDEPVQAQQLDLMFDDARPVPHDPIAEATLRRVSEIQAREAERERAERMGAHVPPMFDANAPGEKPWMGANLHLDAADRNTA